jgi:hypothetical protein
VALHATPYERSPAFAVLGLEIGLGLDQAIDHPPVDNGIWGENEFSEVFEGKRGVAGMITYPWPPLDANMSGVKPFWKLPVTATLTYAPALMSSLVIPLWSICKGVKIYLGIFWKE